MEENFRALKPYLRGLPLIILTMIIGLFVAKKYLNYVTPMYESTAKIKLADISEGMPSSNLFKDFDVFATSNKIAAEIEVLKSEILLDKVLNELDFDLEIFRKGKLKTVELYKQSPIKIKYKNITKKAYDKLYDLKILNQNNFEIFNKENGETYKGTLNNSVKLPNIELNISLNDTFLLQNPKLDLISDYQFQIHSRQKLISKIKKNLDISSVDKDVPIIRISFKSTNQIKTAKLSNKLTEIYITDYIENKYKAANITVNFLEGRIAVVLDKLTNSEQNIQNYRDNKRIINIKQETETNLRQVAQFEIQQINLKMKLESIKKLEKYIQNGKDNFLDLAPNFEAFTDLLSTEMVKKIKTLQAEKRDLLLIYTPEHEKIKVVESKIKDLTSYLTESISNTRRSLEVQFNSLNNKITVSKKSFIGVPEKEKMLKILNREFAIYQQSYNFLNEKKMEAEIAQAAKIAFHRIITHAEIPKKPISPNRSIIKIVSVLLAMFMALAFIFIVHLLKAKVNDKHTIESNSLITITALTPRLKDTKTIKNYFLKLAIQLEVKKIIKDKEILCFSSFDLDQGASFNALHLAKALISQRRKILLLDVNNELELVKNNTNEITTNNNLDILSLTDPKFNHFTKEMMQAYIKEVGENYEVVVLLNEKINSQKSILMMSVATTNLVVLDTRLTPANKIIEVDLLKEEFKLEPMYFVLNRFAYNPNLIKEIILVVKPMLKKIKRRIHN